MTMIILLYGVIYTAVLVFLIACAFGQFTMRACHFTCGGNYILCPTKNRNAPNMEGRTSRRRIGGRNRRRSILLVN